MSVIFTSWLRVKCTASWS